MPVNSFSQDMRLLDMTLPKRDDIRFFPYGSHDNDSGKNVNRCHGAYQYCLECHPHLGCSLVHDYTSVVSRWARICSPEILFEDFTATEIAGVCDAL